jgi:hypothetical protein
MIIIWHPVKDALSADGLCQGEDAMIRRRTSLYLGKKLFE